MGAVAGEGLINEHAMTRKVTGNEGANCFMGEGDMRGRERG